jgi:uncharacterized RDD family membrane protein YckC
VPYVGVGRRFLAFLVDLILSVVWNAPFAEVVRTPGHVQYRLVNGRFGAVALIWFLYYVVMETAFGGTVGKLVTGIRVVRQDGSKPDLVTSLKRTLARVVDGFPYVIPYLVGAIVVWSSPTRQRLGDRWAKTYVVRAGTKPTAPAMPAAPGASAAWPSPAGAAPPIGVWPPPVPPPPPLPPEDPNPTGAGG